MSEFERSWMESERHRHQRLLWALKQECQEVPAPLPSLEPATPTVAAELPVPSQTPSRVTQEESGPPQKQRILRQPATGGLGQRGKTVVR